MARTANPKRPEALLDAVVGYLMTHGVADVALRPLAKAVRSSPRVLLYYFGSKEELVARALKRLRERQRAGFARMKQADVQDPIEVCRAVWRQLAAPQTEPLFRLFLQAYSMGLQQPQRFAAFLHDAIEDWLEFLAAPRLAAGASPAAARAYATVVLAGFRGFMLDYCASHDRRRVEAAVELWLRSLETIPL
ncbi:MAG: TetR/AcrR family transcriptional regulator [Steroidobacteraceae bacterium]